MGITASGNNGTTYDPVASGMHRAVCYRIYDLGTQHNQKWDAYQHKVLLVWELPDERMEIEKDGEKLDLPRVVSREFTLSLSEKSHLRPFLESWRGKAFTDEQLISFDITVLVGISCMVNVTHNEKDGNTYANVAAVTPLMKGTPSFKSENESLFFSMEDGMEIPSDTPEWIIKKIEASEECKDRAEYATHSQGGPPMDNPPIDSYDGQEEPPF